MDLSRPVHAVIPSLDGPVLEVLAGTTQPLTGRQVHVLARTGSVAGVRKVLARLADQGVVTVTEAGGAAFLYTLNRRHIAAPAVEILTRLRTILIERLRAEFSGWAQSPVHASLFGSAARGDGTTGSDLDILVIRAERVAADDPAWHDQLDNLSQAAEAWTGNHAQIYELDLTELRRHVSAREAIVADWRRDGILLHGVELHQLLTRRRTRTSR